MRNMYLGESENEVHSCDGRKQIEEDDGDGKEDSRNDGFLVLTYTIVNTTRRFRFFRKYISTVR